MSNNNNTMSNNNNTMASNNTNSTLTTSSRTLSRSSSSMDSNNNGAPFSIFRSFHTKPILPLSLLGCLLCLGKTLLDLSAVSRYSGHMVAQQEGAYAGYDPSQSFFLGDAGGMEDGMIITTTTTRQNQKQKKSTEEDFPNQLTKENNNNDDKPPPPDEHPPEPLIKESEETRSSSNQHQQPPSFLKYNPDTDTQPPLRADGTPAWRQRMETKMTLQPDYDCLYQLQDEIAQQQNAWHWQKVPPMTMILPEYVQSKGQKDGGDGTTEDDDDSDSSSFHQWPHETQLETDDNLNLNYTHITIMWRIEHLNQTLLHTEGAWTCHSLRRQDDNGQVLQHTTSPPAIHPQDPSHHRIVLACPRNTTSVTLDAPNAYKIEKTHNRQIVYNIPAQICPYRHRPNAYLTSCTMIKGDLAWRQLPEWMAFMRLMGTEHVYVYLNERFPNPWTMKEEHYANDDNKDTRHPLYSNLTVPPAWRHAVRRLVHDLPHLANYVSFIPLQDGLRKDFQMQFSQLHDCLLRAKGNSVGSSGSGGNFQSGTGYPNTHWLTLNDVDEYFQVMGRKLGKQRRQKRHVAKITDLTRKYDNHTIHGMRALNWLFVDPAQGNPYKLNTTESAANDEQQRSLTIEQFPYRYAKPMKKTRWKWLYRPGHITYNSVHEITLAQGPPIHMHPTADLRSAHYKFPLLQIEDPELVTKQLVIEPDSSLRDTLGPAVRHVLQHGMEEDQT